jgi:integrase
VDRLVADGLAPTTIELSVAPLRAIYRRAEQLDIVRHNPTRGLSVPGERRSKLEIIPPAKALALLAVIDRADRAVWATARYAGLRRGELYVLRPEDIDLAAGEIHVQRGWDFKEASSPPRPRPPTGACRFPRRCATTWTSNCSRSRASTCSAVPYRARKMIERGTEAMTAAGLKAFHGCRHTYASYMIAAGVNARRSASSWGTARSQSPSTATGS